MRATAARSNAACAHITTKIRPVAMKIVPKASPVTRACSAPASPCRGTCASANTTDVSTGCGATDITSIASTPGSPNPRSAPARRSSVNCREASMRNSPDLNRATGWCGHSAPSPGAATSYDYDPGVASAARRTTANVRRAAIARPEVASGGRSAHIGPMSGRARVGWSFVILATLLLTCLVTLTQVGRPGAPPFAALHHRELATWIAWLLLAPAIVWAANRYPFGEGSAFGWLCRHLALGVAFSVAGMALAALVTTLFQSDSTHASAPSRIAVAAEGLLLYALVALAAQALGYHSAARTRDAV